MAFPTSIEAAIYFQEAYNNLSTTLSQICGISDTTVYVASTTNFPSIGWITIEDEIRSYTGTTTGSFTGCTPGSDGTTAAEHAAGKAVSLTLPAIAWNHAIAELRATQTAFGTAKAGVATGVEVTTGTDNTKIVTPKAIGDADVNTRLKSKIITATRDMTAASGDVSYTGLDFKPTAILCIGTIGATAFFSIGFADSARAGSDITQYGANTLIKTDFLVNVATSSGVEQRAIVKTYDANVGFTLTWTKNGSPTGTADLKFLCFR